MSMASCASSGGWMQLHLQFGHMHVRRVYASGPYTVRVDKQTMVPLWHLLASVFTPLQRVAGCAGSPARWPTMPKRHVRYQPCGWQWGCCSCDLQLVVSQVVCTPSRLVWAIGISAEPGSRARHVLEQSHFNHSINEICVYIRPLRGDTYCNFTQGQPHT